MLPRLSIRQKLIVSYTAIALLTGVNALYSYHQITQISAPLKNDIPESITNIQKSSELDALAREIKYYDELLTQSARNYAFTSDKKWEDRYNAAVPELDRIIKDAIAKGDDEDRAFFSSVDVANLALVDLEVASLDLVDKGKAPDAIVILEGEEYWKQKAIYSKGLMDYVERRSTKRAETIQSSTELIRRETAKTVDIIQSTIILLGLISTGIFFLGLLFGIFFSRTISTSIKELTVSANDIAKGNFNKRVSVSTKDEIGTLATTFNDMASSLQLSRNTLEEKTEELSARMIEVEHINKLMVGRELKMAELKKEIEVLKGHPPKEG